MARRGPTASDFLVNTTLTLNMNLNHLQKERKRQFDVASLLAPENEMLEKSAPLGTTISPASTTKSVKSDEDCDISSRSPSPISPPSKNLKKWVRNTQKKIRWVTRRRKLQIGIRLKTLVMKTSKKKLMDQDACSIKFQNYPLQLLLELQVTLKILIQGSLHNSEKTAELIVAVNAVDMRSQRTESIHLWPLQWSHHKMKLCFPTKSYQGCHREFKGIHFHLIQIIHLIFFKTILPLHPLCSSRLVTEKWHQEWQIQIKNPISWIRIVNGCYRRTNQLINDYKYFLLSFNHN